MANGDTFSDTAKSVSIKIFAAKVLKALQLKDTGNRSKPKRELMDSPQLIFLLVKAKDPCVMSRTRPSSRFLCATLKAGREGLGMRLDLGCVDTCS